LNLRPSGYASAKERPRRPLLSVTVHHFPPVKGFSELHRRYQGRSLCASRLQTRDRLGMGAHDQRPSGFLRVVPRRCASATEFPSDEGGTFPKPLDLGGSNTSSVTVSVSGPFAVMRVALSSKRRSEASTEASKNHLLSLPSSFDRATHPQLVAGVLTLAGELQLVVVEPSTQLVVSPRVVEVLVGTGGGADPRSVIT
jgi:hypothetical protein